MKSELAYLALVADGVAEHVKAQAFAAAESELAAAGVTVARLAELAQRRKPDDDGAARVRLVYDRAASAAVDVLRGAGVKPGVIEGIAFQVRIMAAEIPARRRRKAR